MKIKGWRKDKQQSMKNYYIYDNEHSNTSIKIFKPLHGRFWCVSILGRGRFQPEYLAGGNSGFHDASKQQALDLAFSWMRIHLRG